MKLLAPATLAVALLASSSAFAAEKTVTLAVQNMTCVACPYIVQKTLESVPGVQTVSVQFKKKTAVVTYDDAKTSIETLTTATTNAGYPSKPAG